MQEYNDNGRKDGRRQSYSESQRRPSGQRRFSGQQRSYEQRRPSGQQRPSGQKRPYGQRQTKERIPENGQVRRPPQQREGFSNKQGKNTGAVPKRRRAKRPLTPKQAARKKRMKIALFVAELFIICILIVVCWGVSKANKMQHVVIRDKDIIINPGIEIEDAETNVLKGYRNIALFGVDSRAGELNKSTRTDTIMIASINLDTKEVKLVSVYRDTWLNQSNDSYNKANAAYARGGAKQAINMLNMNLDLNITDYVTIGFDGLIDVIDAVGGVEIDVHESEISYLNDYQISMIGKPDGTLNAAGEPNYYAEPGVQYTPVTHSGVQKLNGLQATAYARIRYVGSDLQRASRQRTVLTKTAEKAVTLNPVTLNKIADAVFPMISTSLDNKEILSLLSDIASYKVGETSGFPFEGYIEPAGRVGKASVVVPIDLEKNVSLLHGFLFGEEDYEPTDTVKRCSRKIASDTGKSYNGE